MKVPYLMTPGPTQVRENIRLARAQECTNPDIDVNFYEFYKETCLHIGEFLKTKEDVFILSGEGILGLEAACASLTEQGDRVLVLDNGIFGEGFADFVTMYGGEAVLFKSDRTKAIDANDLREFLEKDHNFKYATIVHCDTPSGVLNPMGLICPLLKEYNIITVVDSVAAMGGEPLLTDEWQIDIALGGSQKCVSAPPGLTLLSISQDAWLAMENRKTPIASYYCNLLIWKDYYKNKWFPYTMPISDIQGLRVAIDNILEEGLENMQDRHARVAAYTRERLQEAGLELYLESGFSNTVTVVKVPDTINGGQSLLDYMREQYNIMVAGSFGYLQNKVIRIGHMGENAYMGKVKITIDTLIEAVESFKKL
ncbi:MAG TPA: alanine--glyoxylate aminotransferase family protein [Epulopiscium sp.]|nr:alanine--glyoxylate aminotransferase family protein [Candidatus Epulonipiscium sp.]